MYYFLLMEKRQFSRINDNYDGPNVKEQIKLYWGENKKLFIIFAVVSWGEKIKLLFPDYSRRKVN